MSDACACAASAAIKLMSVIEAASAALRANFLMILSK
jgi:hypothetical protein